MTTMSYKTPANRSEALLRRLALVGYRAHVVRRPLLSPVWEIEIEHVDDEELDRVRELVRTLEPLADPVIVPRQRRR